MRQTTVSATSSGVTEYKCIDRRGNAGTTYLVIVDMENGAGMVDFEFTPDDCIDDTPTLWIQHDILKDVSESCASTISVPFQAFRMNVLSYTSGTISVRVVQGGYHGY